MAGALPPPALQESHCTRRKAQGQRYKVISSSNGVESNVLSLPQTAAHQGRCGCASRRDLPVLEGKRLTWILAASLALSVFLLAGPWPVRRQSCAALLDRKGCGRCNNQVAALQGRWSSAHLLFHPRRRQRRRRGLRDFGGVFQVRPRGRGLSAPLHECTHEVGLQSSVLTREHAAALKYITTASASARRRPLHAKGTAHGAIVAFHRGGLLFP